MICLFFLFRSILLIKPLILTNNLQFIFSLIFLKTCFYLYEQLFCLNLMMQVKVRWGCWHQYITLFDSGNYR